MNSQQEPTMAAGMVISMVLVATKYAKPSRMASTQVSPSMPPWMPSSISRKLTL